MTSCIPWQHRREVFHEDRDCELNLLPSSTSSTLIAVQFLPVLTSEKTRYNYSIERVQNLTVSISAIVGSCKVEKE